MDAVAETTCLNFSRAIIATGKSLVAPKTPGLKKIPYLRSDNLCSLKAMPKTLAVFKADAIGVEIAQVGYGLGSNIIDTWV